MAGNDSPSLTECHVTVAASGKEGVVGARGSHRETEKSKSSKTGGNKTAQQE
jgi:hypothetical protein